MTEKFEAEWDKDGNPPPELRERHEALCTMATARTRETGGDPELGEDE